MTEEYVTDKDYEAYFGTLNGLRSRIATDLPVRPGLRVLDMATGYGYFAVEVAKRDASLKVTAIDISEDSVNRARETVRGEALQDRIEILRMDATKMAFDREEFDIVVNFGGLEDIHMTRGKAGVERAFFEVSRVLKPDGQYSFVTTPPEEMETKAQRLEVALYSYVCDATCLSAEEYQRMAKEAGLKLAGKRTYYTGKKLTVEQAKEEVRFACHDAPKIYGIKTPSFEEVWSRFGKQIEKHGLGQYSKAVLFTAQKLLNIAGPGLTI